METTSKTLQGGHSMSGWIKCADSLPKKNGKYLVSLRNRRYTGGCVEVCYFAKSLYRVDRYDFADKRGKSGWYDYDNEWGHHEITDVVAWQELPEPLKEDESNG